MNAHDPIEEVLKRYSPAGPAASLRGRVLQSAAASQATARRRPSPFWMAIAAMLLVAVGLHFAVRDISARTTSRIGMGPAIWTTSADEAADLLGGDRAARGYIALGLMGSDDRSNLTSGRTLP